MTVTSPDISVFDISVLWDISTLHPTVKLTNRSAGARLNNVTYWFNVIDGGGVEFHTGSVSEPDKIGVWSSFTLAKKIPTIFGRIQFNSVFSVKCYAKDSSGNTFTFPIDTFICDPAGVPSCDKKKGSHNDNFGEALVLIETKCDIGRLYVEDKTNYSYQGFAGRKLSTKCALQFPIDKTGYAPAKTEVLNQSNFLVPVSFSSDGYQMYWESIYLYDITVNSQVQIKFKYKRTFAVRCNVDLCSIFSELERLESRMQFDGCSNEDRNKLLLINSKVNRVLIARMQPTCNVDIGKLIDEIKELGGFDCGCDNFGNEGIHSLIAPTESCYNPTGLSVTVIEPYTVRYYIGANDTGIIPTESEILAFSNVGNISSSGNNISVDFTPFYGAPHYLIFAEPATEPPKTIYFVTIDNTGPIGPPYTVWFAGTIVGSLRVYITQEPTEFNLVEMRIL